MIRVLIVDDHPIVREGVSTVLEREPDIEVVGMGGTIDEGLRLVASSRPDVVLLDLKLPGAEAGDSVATFVGHNPNIIVFTAYDADDDVFRAIRDGARGYLLKDRPRHRRRDPSGPHRQLLSESASRREAGERRRASARPRRPAEPA